MLWRPGVNGLGVMGFHRLPYRRLFDAAAREHDHLYDLRGDRRARLRADLTFLYRMAGRCHNDLQAAMAIAYFVAVRLLGWLFYRYDR